MNGAPPNLFDIHRKVGFLDLVFAIVDLHEKRIPSRGHGLARLNIQKYRKEKFPPGMLFVVGLIKAARENPIRQHSELGTGSIPVHLDKHLATWGAPAISDP